MANPLKLLFILDPLDSLKTYKDTSIAIMREAALCEHEIYICQQHDVYLRGAFVQISASPFQFVDNEQWYSLENPTALTPKDFNAIILRKDPPFDSEYLYTTYLLELAQNQGGRVLNNPSSVRSWNEKLSVCKFPKFAPEFLVTANNQLIRDFLENHQDVILKPLDGMGGSGIFRIKKDDPNISVILETITAFGTRTVMAQRYLPAITQGDKRILVINGEPLPFALARIPKAGETRANLAAGGTGIAQPLSDRDLEIAISIGKVLKSEGLFLVGLDVIGEHLTEINVTSPTGMVEIASQTLHLNKPCNPAKTFLNALEQIC